MGVSEEEPRTNGIVEIVENIIQLSFPKLIAAGTWPVKKRFIYSVMKFYFEDEWGKNSYKN